MMLASWHARGCVILDQRPDWYQYFLQSEMTDAVLIPDLVNQLHNTLDEQGPSSRPMEFNLHVTGGFLSRTLAEQRISRVSSKLIVAYGSSETNVAVLEAKVENPDDLHWLPSTGYRTFEIVDEAGDICPVVTEGQLRLRLGELDCSCYLDDLQASEKVFRSVYSYPGDMAVRRDDGCIRILGRGADEVIAMGSEHWPEQADLNNLGHEFAQFDPVRFAIVYPFPSTQTGFTKIDRIALRKLVFTVQ